MHTENLLSHRYLVIKTTFMKYIFELCDLYINLLNISGLVVLFTVAIQMISFLE